MAHAFKSQYSGRQEDLCEFFRSSLIYIATSRIARTIKRLCQKNKKVTRKAGPDVISL